ncbi:hypothetical protein FPZ49_19215 [Paenibacillus cremeus]|uniref:Uncharacterized protein n=1 Tax=Paenibacillus cremeus TaxID=2163881 RepID=A0A559K8D3_9BACL|nr:hypothetical protein FPZ49_19215 [Paenibacillus cremeus]
MIILSMGQPPWYSWPEFDKEKDQLYPNASSAVVKRYKLEQKRWERDLRRMWAHLENPPDANVKIIPLDDELVLIRELDEDRNIDRETFGFINGGK